MSTSNRIKNVAIVGAGGNSGKFMTEALLKTGKHTLTAITRLDSRSVFPDGVISRKVDYSNPETFVEALKDQDALIITLSGHVPNVAETQLQLVKAAGEAGVPWIFPNEWSPDSANEEVVKDVFLFQNKVATRKAIEELGKSSYIGVCTGFWYEWSLSMSAAYGFDFANHTVTFFDDGDAKLSTSTWPQVGRAVAALLSLPVKPEDSNKDACLESLKNKVIYVNSFTVSQKDMLASVLRVTGTKESEWTITKEVSHERYATGLKEMKEGQRVGFAKMLYTRLFFPDGSGDFEHNKGTLNDLLGLPEEDIDAATQRAIDRSKTTNWVSGGR